MMKRIILNIISAYQLYVSPLLGQHCRFYPSCSHYFQQAVCQYGLFRGALKGLYRIARCNPFSAGGYNPIVK